MAVVTDLRARFHDAEPMVRLPVDLPKGVEHGDPRGERAYGCGCLPCGAARNAYEHDRRLRVARRAEQRRRE